MGTYLVTRATYANAEVEADDLADAMRRAATLPDGEWFVCEQGVVDAVAVEDAEEGASNE